jgi:Fibronectin type III domain
MQRTLVRLTIGLCLTASAFGIAAGVGVGIAGALPILPGKPTNVHALAQSDQIQVSWKAPAPGTSAITGYKAMARSGTRAFGAVACATATTSCTITGVTPGITYSVQVEAKNMSGFGSWSTAVRVVTGAPFPPTGVTAAPGDSSATVKFTPPAVDNASITSYTVTANPGGQTCVSTTSFPCTVTGLTNGTAYTFTATATNPYGTSIASTPSAAVTPQPVPGAPTGASAVAGNASALVSWTAPAPNGDPVTSYKATSLPGGKTCTAHAPTTSCTVTGLPNGRSFTFSVTATNLIGTGPASSATAPVTPMAPTVPGAPSGVTATLDTSNPNNYAWYTIGFTQGASGGSTITNNNVTVTDLTNSHVLGPITSAAGSPIEIPYANTADGTSTGAVVASPGDTLQFAVTATNAVGTSAPTTVTTVLPDWTPLAPTGVSASPGDTTAAVSWTAPFSPPNAPAIASYLVTDGSGDTCTATAPTTTCTVTGLTDGTAYSFTVAAISATGVTGAASAPVSVTPVTVPGVPTGVSATATTISGTPGADVNYTAPASDGGSPITGYTVVVVDQTTSTTTDVAGSSSFAAVTGLTATDSYTFSVYATNGVGNSAASTPIQAVPQGPTSVTGTSHGDGTATISWTPSNVTLGNPVTGFGVSTFDFTTFVVGPSDSVDSSTTTTNLAGFTVGDTYDVCVSAQNSQAQANETCTEFTA